MSIKAPKIHLALQFVMKNHFRVADVIAVRIGRSISKIGQFMTASGSTLVYYHSDRDPDFHHHESDGTALDITKITGGTKARIIQFLTKTGSEMDFGNSAEATQGLLPASTTGDTGTAVETDDPPENEDVDLGGPLPTIHEDVDEDEVDLTVESFYQELMDEQELEQVDDDTEIVTYPVHMVPEGTVAFEELSRGNVSASEEECTDMYMAIDMDTDDISTTCDSDELGEYIELCFDEDMESIILDEHQSVGQGEIATLRVYLSSEANKRAGVVKEDDFLTIRTSFAFGVKESWLAIYFHKKEKHY